jgi:mannose-6-phosphate isomerase class I
MMKQQQNSDLPLFIYDYQKYVSVNSQNENHSPQTFWPQGLVAQVKIVMFGSDVFAHIYRVS